MQFKQPEFLYALAVLLIPIVIHFFQLRRFKNEPFTNVFFLKQLVQQTRKSSQLKKWLLLITRLFILTALIIAFAQPYFGSPINNTKQSEVVVYLDNSFSMEATGANGPLLKRAVNDILTFFDPNQKISLFTNTNTFKDVSIVDLKAELLTLPYSSNQLTSENLLLKAESLFTTKSADNEFVIISDFQKSTAELPPFKHTSVNLRPIMLSAQNPKNVAIDSVYFNQPLGNTPTLTVKLKAINTDAVVAISLAKDSLLISKATVDLKETTTAQFSIPNTNGFNGTLAIKDANGLTFDNSMYFSINLPKKISILEIHDETPIYLNKIYTEADYIFTTSRFDSVDFNSINAQQVIILNSLETIPLALQSTLQSFANSGGILVVIPNEASDLQAYNSFLKPFGFSGIKRQSTMRQLTTINYKHPLYANDVFYKEEHTFQFPKIKTVFGFDTVKQSAILSYEDQSPFLIENSNVFVFTGAFEAQETDFKQSQLIVPTFDKIAKLALKPSNLYYEIGAPNSFDINANLSPDNVVTLVKETERFIPEQRVYTDKVSVSTQDIPVSSGTYSVESKAVNYGFVSYNYTRNESALDYYDNSIFNAKHNVYKSVKDYSLDIKSETKMDRLWKWFVTFALLFLCIELFILNFFK